MERLPVVDATAPPQRLAMFRILTGGFAVGYLLVRLPAFAELADRDPAGFEPIGVLTPLDGALPRRLVLALIVVTLATGLAHTVGWRFRLTGPAFAAGLLVLDHVPQLVGPAPPLREPDRPLRDRRRRLPRRRRMVVRRPPTPTVTSRPDRVRLAAGARVADPRAHLPDRRYRQAALRRTRLDRQRHAPQPRRLLSGPARAARWHAVTARAPRRRVRLDLHADGRRRGARRAGCTGRPGRRSRCATSGSPRRGCCTPASSP